MQLSNCPIKSCASKQSFNHHSSNFNEQLILFYELIKKKENTSCIKFFNSFSNVKEKLNIKQIQ